jgi:hypothetical protein
MTEQPQPEAEITEHAPQSFLDFLAYQHGGVLVKELGQQVREITEALLLHKSEFNGKPVGELVVKFGFTLDEDNMIRVKAIHETRRPKAPATSTIMFLGATGDLMGHNPKQLSMFPRR